SERLFAFLLPVSGKGVVIAPGFEEQRAAVEVDKRFDIRVWQEDENPEALIAGLLKEWGAATGKIAVDGSARVFVFNKMGLAAPAMQVETAATTTHEYLGE